VSHIGLASGKREDEVIVQEVFKREGAQDNVFIGKKGVHRIGRLIVSRP